MENTSNKIYVLARVDDAGVRQVLTGCTDKQEAEAVLQEYVDYYRQNGFKKSGHYTKHNGIENIIGLVRLLPPGAEDKAKQRRDFSTYLFELYEFDAMHPGDTLINLHTGTIWDYLPKK